ncbi:MAG: multidrug effflux MFS transporter [Rhodobacteraceae bacterium]|nr:multidrug effflux MFS transporter [Paracoccaceae bacterium]
MPALNLHISNKLGRSVENHVKPVWLDKTTPPHVVTLVAIAGIGALSMNIFLPALPAMASFFDVDYALIQLAISAYLGVVALLQIIIGPLSDRFGRRPVLLGGLGIFVLATLGCVLATDIETLLGFRMLQAAVASGIVLSRAIVRDMVPPEKAASMIGYVTMGMSLMPMIGPALGGVLNDAFGWQSSFIMLGVSGLLVLFLIYADLGETNQHKSASFGAQFRAYPDLIRARRFWGYTLTAGFASGAFFSFLGGAPFISKEVLGLSATEMGGYFGIVAFGYMVGNFFSGRYSQRAGINLMMVMGSVVATFGALISLALFEFGILHPLSLFGPMFFVGIGNGMTLPNANAGIVSVRPHLAGSASGLSGAITIGSGAALSALAGALLTPETGAMPLFALMVAVSLLAILASFYVIWVAKRAEPLGKDGFS